MRAVHRWSLVAATCALAVVVPAGVRAWPVPDRHLSAAQVLVLVRAGADTSYSGTVETQGRLGLPVSDHFTDIADLLGGQTRLRVWWRSGDDWRVDKLLDTGEVDLFHHRDATVEWDYERGEARSGIDPAIRLPRDADLLPPTLARRALVDVTPSDVTRLPPRRVAGVDTVGLRIDPSDPRTSIDHVDLWADPTTGIVLALDVYGTGDQPALSTAFSSVDLHTPGPAQTLFHPARGVHQSVGDVLDIADAANQFAPFLPPEEVAGLPKTASSRGAVGIYGTGLTQVMALPLQPRDAGDLEDQLKTNGASLVGGTPLLRVGPLGVYLVITNKPVEVGVDLSEGLTFAWLVTGTVTDQTLLRAANDLADGAQFR